MNLLVNKMKDVKRELTNLKTAHQRGINLKIFREEITFSKSSIGFYDGTITVTFDTNFAAYPFAYVLGYSLGPDSPSFYSFDTDSVFYRDSGYTMDFVGEFIYYPEELEPKFVLVSTSPPTSITYTWS